MKDKVFFEGTFAVPRYFVAEKNPAYPSAKKLFDLIVWPKPITRADGRKHRFNAFCSLLWAVTTDKNWVAHTILNKSHYDISKWPINYRAMADTVRVLKKMGWLVVVGERTKNRNIRYIAPEKSPMRRMAHFKVGELSWCPPVVSIRLGNTDLVKAPLNVELMANPHWRKWIAKHLDPPVADLNDKLLDHSFTLFPFGKADEYVEVRYQRIYTNLPQDDGSPWLAHGRIYPLTFSFPSKQKGWRKMTLIDGKPTVEVDVHASSLRLLAGDGRIGFDLPDVEDLYSHGRLAGLKRNLTKTVIQAVINGVFLDRKSWPKSFAEDKKTAALMDGEDWLAYADAVRETYPALADIPEGFGMDLFLHESSIIIRSMNYLLDKGIGCLSIHDCLIVPKENEEDAKSAFYIAYDHSGYQRPKLSVE
jgi:hypothetical protein